jgi:hypothetical protein
MNQFSNKIKEFKNKIEKEEFKDYIPNDDSKKTNTSKNTTVTTNKQTPKYSELIKALETKDASKIVNTFNSHYGNSLDLSEQFYTEFVKDPNFTTLIKEIPLPLYRLSLPKQLHKLNDSNKNNAFRKWLNDHRPTDEYKPNKLAADDYNMSIYTLLGLDYEAVMKRYDDLEEKDKKIIQMYKDKSNNIYKVINQYLQNNLIFSTNDVDLRGHISSQNYSLPRILRRYKDTKPWGGVDADYLITEDDLENNKNKSREKVYKFIEYFTNELNRIIYTVPTLSSDVSVCRGVETDPMKWDTISGGTFKNKTFISTSVNDEVCEKFTNKYQWSGKILTYKIKDKKIKPGFVLKGTLKSGSHVLFIGALDIHDATTEFEILLPSCTSTKLISSLVNGSYNVSYIIPESLCPTDLTHIRNPYTKRDTKKIS